MKETSEKKLPMDDFKKLNGKVSKQMGVAKRLRVASLNTHLICVLCSGYYVEATAIVECLHTFCRSCIVKYLQSNNFCPICDVQIHHIKPWLSLRPDRILQDLVYKLVPGLYQDEMKRRRQFYSRLGHLDVGEGEAGGFLPHGARFFSQDDSISLSLEYYYGQDMEQEEEEEEEQRDTEDSSADEKLKEKPRRYLQCPAAVTIRHLKKFLRMKYGIGVDCWVDIIYNDECLPDDFSLIDVAYTFKWKRTSPMRFSYRIFSKAALREMKSQKNFQTSRVDKREGRKTKHQSSLEQQMQNEYLGNFNLNPKNSEYYKTQNYSKTKNCSNNNNYNTVNNNKNKTTLSKNGDSGNNNSGTVNSKNGSVFSGTCSGGKSNNSSGANEHHANNNNVTIKNNNAASEKNKKKEEVKMKENKDWEDASRDNIFHSSEDSNTSMLRIASEKEESFKENSEDSQESVLMEVKSRSKSISLTNYEEDAVDSFTAKKLLKNKHKLQGKREKKKQRENVPVKRRKSSSHVDEYEKKKKKLSSVERRRKTIAEEFGLKEETGNILEGYPGTEDEDAESFGKLKNEALRKVFVSKEKPENVKKKDEVVRKKKRKKSKHHEGVAKKRKVEEVVNSPSIMSIAKDALKLKVKLSPSKPTVETASSNNESEESQKLKIVEEAEEDEKKSEESSKKAATDKERLLHLRAVRHKNNPKTYINAPPSLTISKIDSSEQQPVKTTLVESKPSLEITLVKPAEVSKVKKAEVNAEPRAEVEPKKVETSDKESRKPDVDSFGVLDLSDKSTRTKEISSSSSSSKETSETVEKSKKSSHQSILQIAQNLVNRKLSPILPDNPLRLNVPADSSVTAAAMRNLKTLSDTAVNILMAAQTKNFAAESQKRPFPPLVSSPAHKPSPPPTAVKPSKDGENGSGLKIPVYPLARERTNPVPPVPNLHEIYPRNRALNVGKSSPSPSPSPSTAAPAPIIKPGQNQTVRQIPNPFVILNRHGQQNQNQNLASPPVPSAKAENGEDGAAKQKFNSASLLQSLKGKPPVPKLEDIARFNVNKSSSNEIKMIVPKILNNNNNNPKTVQNCSEGSFYGVKNGVERKGHLKFNSINSFRRVENMAKNIESVAAGLTARAVSNAMIDAK